MERSDSIVKLAAALVKAQAEFEPVEKAQDNPHFNSKYADFAQVRKKIDPLLTKHGLAVVQLVGNEELTSILLHESGEYISEVMNLYVSKTRSDRQTGATIIIPPDPQSQGSAITYAKRYAYMAITGAVAGGEDDDGEAATAHSNRPQTLADASGVDELLGGSQSAPEPSVPVEKPAVASEPAAAQGAGGGPTETKNDAAVEKAAKAQDDKEKLRKLIGEHRAILEGFFPDVWATVVKWAEERKIDLDNIPDNKLRALETSLRKQVDKLAPPSEAIETPPVE